MTDQSSEKTTTKGSSDESAGRRQFRLRVDDRNMQTSYANAFRTNGTAEEVILDFGINLAGLSSTENSQEMIFQINHRIIMNYHSAKRLAIALSQLIRQHEEQFGELELDAARRRKSQGSS